MTVESILTRELDIRFIDARTIVNEAKLNLHIHGYPSPEQELEIYEEAFRIFNIERPEVEKRAMRRLSECLQAAKTPCGCPLSSSLASLDLDVSCSEIESVPDWMNSSERSSFSSSSAARRHLKSMWPLGRR